MAPAACPSCNPPSKIYFKLFGLFLHLADFYRASISFLLGMENLQNLGRYQNPEETTNPMRSFSWVRV
ncbi:hypothetical protein THAOC_09539 [Thalassiosira oceanica]|uniref:Uncharacterized protein n=1 Tax=Thalassiosira oceanica TaxID=159749 RepID=K0SSF5_THAOC|nr:hypothetical protein THAOC_09539 [Thalassiosira oceanica]|eukprot:EJK69223.1 hypothetical protein THAOC_09539 [Thalassiosira oceanica]